MTAAQAHSLTRLTGEHETVDLVATESAVTASHLLVVCDRWTEERWVQVALDGETRPVERPSEPWRVIA